MGIKLLVFTMFFFTLISEARPISYSGGSTLMAFSGNMYNSVYYHFSPTYRYSVGIESVEDKFFNQQYSYFRFTYLLNRRNTENSQGNLYFQSGLSSDGLDGHFYGLHGDWETRRWFIGFNYRDVKNSLKNYTDQFLQVGVAPYLGAYGDFHTWIMIKTKKNTLLGDWSTFPVLKFFKGNFLIEFGYNDQTEWDAHIMYRF